MSPIDASSEILKVTGLDTNTGELSFESSTFIVIFTSESILSAALTAITYEKGMQIITVYYKLNKKVLMKVLTVKLYSTMPLSKSSWSEFFTNISKDEDLITSVTDNSKGVVSSESFKKKWESWMIKIKVVILSSDK